MAVPTPADVRAGSQPAYDPKTKTSNDRSSGRTHAYQDGLDPGMPTHLLRVRLRQAGYDIDPTGPKSLRLITAVHNYNATQAKGAQGKHGWNTLGPQRGERLVRQGGAIIRPDRPSPPGHVVPDTPVKPGTGVGKQGKVTVLPKTKGAKGPKGSPTGYVGSGAPDPNLVKINQRLPDPYKQQLISESLYNTGAQQIPDSFAQSMAGEQYDPAILQDKLQISRAPRDQAQQQADIGNWWGQVLGTLDKSKARAGGYTTQATGAQDAISKGLLASFGGDANSGAQAIATQGQADNAMLQGIGDSNSQFLNDMSPFLQAQKASDLKGNQASNVAHQQDLQASLRSDQGARGQALSNARYQILGQNNDIRNNALNTLLQIKGLNNQSRAQNLNELSQLQQNAIAAAMGGAQIDALNIQNKQTATGGFIPWARLGGPDRQAIVQQALQGVMANDGGLAPGVTPAQAWNIARKKLYSMGYSGAQQKASVNPSRRGIDTMIGQIVGGAATISGARQPGTAGYVPPTTQ